MGAKLKESYLRLVVTHLVSHTVLTIPQPAQVIADLVGYIAPGTGKLAHFSPTPCAKGPCTCQWVGTWPGLAILAPFKAQTPHASSPPHIAQGTAVRIPPFSLVCTYCNTYWRTYSVQSVRKAYSDSEKAPYTL